MGGTTGHDHGILIIGIEIINPNNDYAKGRLNPDCLFIRSLLDSAGT